jgi:hypothetical protein
MKDSPDIGGSYNYQLPGVPTDNLPANHAIKPCHCENSSGLVYFINAFPYFVDQQNLCVIALLTKPPNHDLARTRQVFCLFHERIPLERLCICVLMITVCSTLSTKTSIEQSLTHASSLNYLFKFR